MKQEKKMLFISNRVFWPPMGGHEVEIYHYCRGLHEKYGYEVDIYAFDDPAKLEGVEQPEFLHKVYLADEIGKKTKVGNLIKKTFLSEEKWPIQNSLYYSNENANRITMLVKKEKYDVVIVDMIRLATYYHALDGADCKKILDIDDTLSKRYKRQLKAITKQTVIAGQYNDRLSGFLQKLLSTSLLKKFVLGIEIPRVEKAEKRFSDLYDRVIFVSPIETNEFNERYKTDKAVTVSLGVDYPYFAEDVPAIKAKGRVTFVGNMATSANADSVRYVINQVLPACKKVESAVFIGNYPETLLNDYKDNPKVKFTGKVTDLRIFVKEGMVFLAPIAYGTGIKIKILEAMAMQMPVVTNSIGAEGIPGVNGKHWYVSDDPQEIASYVDELLTSQAHCDEMGEAAGKFVKESFQWDIIFEQFSKLDL